MGRNRLADNGLQHRERLRTPKRAFRLRRGARVDVADVQRSGKLFIGNQLTGLVGEGRLDTVAKQHGLKRSKDTENIGKLFRAYLRRADEGTLSRLLVESSILLAASRGNASAVLKEAASTYKVDTEAITNKVRQEFAAKEKAKKAAQSTTKAANKVA